uniref:IBP-9 n=1 Tax=Navicula glaciei TaxID=335918 RepID=Q108N5_9STRA|nr:IBP-9 [Navicula glaciei]
MMFLAKTVTLLVALVASSVAAEQSAVDLGTAGDFAVLSKAGVSTTGPTEVTRDIGTSPIASTALTGFALIKDSSNTFSTSSLVTGKIYAADYTAPTPSKMTTAISDMSTAFTDAAGRSDPDFLELGAGSIEGETLVAGLYKWGTDVSFTSSLVFDGSATDVWILQVAKDFIVGNGAQMYLTGTAKAENIFIQVSGAVNIGTTAHVEGNILSATAIALQTGSSLNGKALSQTAITLDSVTIVS